MVYQLSKSYKKSGQRKYDPWSWRTIIAPDRVSDELSERVIRWILPWSRGSYPGLRRGTCEILSNRWTWGAVRHWRSGRSSFPKIAAQILYNHMASRIESGLALMAELKIYIDGHEYKPRGWRVVSDRDGDGVLRDARNRVGRRKQADRPDTSK